MIQTPCDRNQAQFPTFSFEAEDFKSICWFDDIFDHDEGVFRVQLPRPAVRDDSGRRVHCRRRRNFTRSIRILPRSHKDGSDPEVQKCATPDVVAITRPTVKIATPSTVAPEKKAASEKQSAVGAFQRIAPRTDAHGQKRRRRLNRLRDRIHLESAGDATSEHSAQSRSDDGRSEQPAAITDNGQKQPATELPNTLRSDTVQPSTDKVVSTNKPAKSKMRKLSPAAEADRAPGVERTGNESDVAGAYRVLIPAEAEPQPETYFQWFRRVVARSRFMTWFAAFYLHWLALLMMAAVVVSIPENAADLFLQASASPEVTNDAPAFEVTPAEIEPLVRNTSTVNAFAASTEPSLDITDQRIPVPAVAPMLPATSMTETSRQPPPVTTRAVPVDTPPEAVEVGSFSAWTEPAQPHAGEPYRIVVQVRLPPEVDRYRASDLQGMVQGSDGYRKYFPPPNAGPLLVNDGYARFTVPIVSADKEVRDMIYVRSKLLKETQQLLLEF